MTENIIEKKDLKWKVHTPNLLSEIMENDGCSILLRPLQAFAGLLYQVGLRAAELNDHELNKLMIRLTLYSVADPESEDFDRELVTKILTDEMQSTTESYEQVVKERDNARKENAELRAQLARCSYDAKRLISCSDSAPATLDTQMHLLEGLEAIAKPLSQQAKLDAEVLRCAEMVNVAYDPTDDEWYEDGGCDDVFNLIKAVRAAKDGK